MGCNGHLLGDRDWCGRNRAADRHPIFFDDLTFIDHSCLDRMASFKAGYEAGGGTVVIEWSDLVAQYQFGPRLGTEEVAKPRTATTQL